jgi:hypothetical protein
MITSLKIEESFSRVIGLADQAKINVSCVFLPVQ